MLPIETPRLRLRPLEGRDATRLSRYRSDPSVARYQSWEAMTIDEAREFIRALPARFLETPGQWCQLAIADKGTDEIIGDIGVCLRAAADTAEIGFTLAPEVQGNGLATEACRAAIELVFRVSGVRTIEAVIDSRNTSAIALVRRLGMSLDRSETAELEGGPCVEHCFLLRR